MELDARLAACAALVRRGSRVADIGTDHAHLPVWLVKTGRCPRAIAADIRPGPAAAARGSVTKAGLADRIDVRVGDGLSPLSAEEADDIVIAGMGGETILAILERAPWIKDPHYRLILQPMTRAEALHEFLFREGFTIETEKVIRDGKHLYPVLSVFYRGLPAEGSPAGEPDPLRCLVGGIPPEGEGRAYLEKQGRALQKKAAGRALSHPEESAAAEELLRALAQYLEKG